MRALIRKQRLEEAIKPERFHARFDEEWKVVEKCDRITEYELRVVHGKRARPVQIPFNILPPWK